MESWLSKIISAGADKKMSYQIEVMIQAKYYFQQSSQKSASTSLINSNIFCSI